MLPFAAGQVLSAFWSTWLESTMDENDEIGRLPFSTFSRVPCPGQESLHSYRDAPALPHNAQVFTGSDPGDAPSAADIDAGLLFNPMAAPAPASLDILNVPMTAIPIPAPLLCISCKYTFCSVVVHIVLTLLFAVIIATFGRVMLDRCGNKALRHRIRTLCVLLPLLQALQCAAAAVTVVKRRPHTWTHEISKLIALVCVLALIVAVSTLLVLMPLQAAAYALRLVAKVRSLSPSPSISQLYTGSAIGSVWFAALDCSTSTTGNTSC